MKNTQIQYIVFDFFGVICSEIAPFWFEKYFDEKKAVILKDKYVSPVDIGAITDEELFNTLASLIGSTPDSVKKEWFDLVKIDQEVVSFIKSIKNNFKIILASNASAEFLYHILRDNNLEKLFDKIIISSELGIIKPNIEYFKKILDILEESPDKFLFIDDNPTNVEAGRKAGIKSYLFKTIKDINFLVK